MESLRIGICDDEMEDLSEIMEMVSCYDPNKQLQIESFLHASDLLLAFNQTPFDIVILDIEMEPPTGFDIAKVLIASETPPVVIFATKSKAYALKGYGIAIRYLQKPIHQLDFFEALDAAIADATAHRLTFQLESTLVSVRLRDVQYIEVIGHYTVVHTLHDKYKFRSTLKEISARLPKGYFASPHKSYIVNLEHIQSATTGKIVLDCGTAIPIGRSRMQKFNNVLYGFLGR